MVEQQIRASCEAGDYNRALTLLIESYGARLYGYLLARSSSRYERSQREQHAQEIYGDFCVDLVRALPRFEWRCQAKTWAYRLAHHALARFYRKPERQNSAAAHEAEALSQVAVAAMGASTLMWREQQESQWTKLREKLEAVEQDLLILRVDEALSWEDIARVLGLIDDASHPDLLAKQAAKLRKRFERTRKKLHQLAVEMGLDVVGGERR